MIQLRIFQFYNGVKAIHIQEKLYFEFQMFIFSQMGDKPYDPLSWCWTRAATVLRVNNRHTAILDSDNHSVFPFQHGIQ